MAQTPAPEYALGYSTYHLRPESGADQRLNGINLGYRHGFTSVWSGEAALTTQSGTEGDGVSLRQWGLMAGPRYSWVWSDRCQGFVHGLVGLEHLKATDGTDSDQKNSLAVAPGVGLDLVLNRHFSVRLQEDYVVSRYAGLTQHSTCFTLGIVARR